MNRPEPCRAVKLMGHPEVYEPCDDTYLLLRSIAVFPGEEILEVGTGTGIIAIHCALHGLRVSATDINPYAIRIARENAKLNDVEINIFESDLFENVHQQYDVIIFNPPYLPTAQKDLIGGWLDKAFDGGEDGTRIILRFIEDLDRFIKPGGRAYLLVSSLDDMDAILSALKEKHISVKSIGEKKLDFEKLFAFELRPTFIFG